MMLLEFCDRTGKRIAYYEWPQGPGNVPPYPIVIVETRPGIKLDADVYIHRIDLPPGQYIPLDFTIVPRSALTFLAEEVWRETEWMCGAPLKSVGGSLAPPELCGTVNMPVRRKCRSCGAPKPVAGASS